jgi:hypothetical protein
MAASGVLIPSPTFFTQRMGFTFFALTLRFRATKMAS